MRINPDDFKPAKRGKSDKFSWNIHSVLKEWEGLDVQVVQIGWDRIHGKCPLDQGETFLCIDVEPHGWLTGGWVMAITTHGKQAIGAYGLFGKEPWWKNEWEYVTESWFRQYARKGVCAVHQSFGHKFVSINRNARVCEYCGEHQRRAVETVKTIKRVDRWLAA